MGRYPTKTIAGIEYAITGAPAYSVQSQGPGFLSRERKVSSREDVGPAAARMLANVGKYANLLLVRNDSAIAQDGSCRRLTLSSYRKRAGGWEHLSGKRIAAIEAAINA